jgi:hypothetical protein
MTHEDMDHQQALDTNDEVQNEVIPVPKSVQISLEPPLVAGELQGGEGMRLTRSGRQNQAKNTDRHHQSRKEAVLKLLKKSPLHQRLTRPQTQHSRGNNAIHEQIIFVDIMIELHSAILGAEPQILYMLILILTSVHMNCCHNSYLKPPSQRQLHLLRRTPPSSPLPPRWSCRHSLLI